MWASLERLSGGMSVARFRRIVRRHTMALRKLNAIEVRERPPRYRVHVEDRYTAAPGVDTVVAHLPTAALVPPDGGRELVAAGIVSGATLHASEGSGRCFAFRPGGAIRVARFGPILLRHTMALRKLTAIEGWEWPPRHRVEVEDHGTTAPGLDTAAHVVAAALVPRDGGRLLVAAGIVVGAALRDFSASE